MPTEERGSISSVKPTGWKSVTYDIVDGGYLYNRCHLIGFQLTGENVNEQNLITGNSYQISGSTVSESTIPAIYRTPTGKRYHLDSDCGGMNSYEVTMDAALAAGLTPCAKCAE